MNEHMKCKKCGMEMDYTNGWIPSYYNPDNHNLDIISEPYCPLCDKEIKETYERN